MLCDRLSYQNCHSTIHVGIKIAQYNISSCLNFATVTVPLSRILLLNLSRLIGGCSAGSRRRGGCRSRTSYITSSDDFRIGAAAVNGSNVGIIIAFACFFALPLNFIVGTITITTVAFAASNTRGFGWDIAIGEGFFVSCLAGRQLQRVIFFELAESTMICCSVSNANAAKIEEDRYRGVQINVMGDV